MLVLLGKCVYVCVCVCVWQCHVALIDQSIDQPVAEMESIGSGPGVFPTALTIQSLTDQTLI